ncbi:MAG: arylsulfatase [Paracoccaceae bacterium]|nr:arylsulfatase [Paracoccaceae bacterium]
MTEFPGKIGRTIEESTPWWPNPPEHDKILPNIVTILFDDTGWADFGCYGSEISTPNIDSLAAAGLRYTNFHVTPLCSPTRACLLTGRNHHNVGVRCLSDADTGFPNGRGAVDRNVPLLPEMLREQGYATYMIGKWHLTPTQEITSAGPFRNWPVNRGFDRYYGFLGGCTDQYAPELVQDNHMVDPPLAAGYHLSEDLCERAISYFRDHASIRRATPFYMHFCFGATHAPIQVHREYVDKYDGVFDKGWDRTREDRLGRQIEFGLVPENTKLVPRNPGVPEWASLSDDEQRLFSRLQAAYAGFLDHSDVQIGRLVAELKRLDLYDNTIFVILSDNGASMEGGITGAVDCNAAYSGVTEPVSEMVTRLDEVGGLLGPSHYPEGWAMAGNTPFRRYKQFVDLGGVRSPLVFSWPKGLENKGGIRHQFLHAVDVAPTLMDLVGERHGTAFDGASFQATLVNPDTPAPRNVQYWEMFGRRAVYCDGWKAVSEHDKGDDYAKDLWHLYDTRNDFSERTDLATLYPDRLAKLQDIWWQEAEANSVMPLDDRTLLDVLAFRQPNGLMCEREITFRPGQGHVPQMSMITSSERPMEITADFNGPLQGEEGVLVATGDRIGGYSLYVKDGQLTFEYIRLRRRRCLSGMLPSETHTCRLVNHLDAERRIHAQLFADDQLLAEAEVGYASHHLSFWGLDIGRDAALPVSDAYDAPFAFPEAKLDRVVVRFFKDLDPMDMAHTAELAQ